ncbi:hypothetical protein V1280_006649 [Bradyrhizobium sp. AZCC 2230]
MTARQTSTSAPPGGFAGHPVTRAHSIEALLIRV